MHYAEILFFGTFATLMTSFTRKGEVIVDHSFSRYLVCSDRDVRYTLGEYRRWQNWAGAFPQSQFRCTSYGSKQQGRLDITSQPPVRYTGISNTEMAPKG